MIVRDEERNLPKALYSIKPLAHEIIIADTGSSDRTIPVAELFGANVLQIPWTGNFSEARNSALAAAHGDWVLVMDADEQISTRDYSRFHQIIADSKQPAAYSMVTRNYSTLSTLENLNAHDGLYPENEAGCGWTPSSKIRLFPSNRGIHFAGAVHELVEPSVTAAGIPAIQIPIPVHHYGELDSARQHRKKTAYYALGRQKLAEAPHDPKSLYELAIQAAELQKFDEAEALWSRFLDIQPDFAVAWFNLGYVLLREGKLHESLEASNKALAINTDYPEARANKLLCEFCLLPPTQAYDVVCSSIQNRPHSTVEKILMALAMCRAGKIYEGKTQLDKLFMQGIDCKKFILEVVRMLRCEGNTRDADLLETVI
jgi:glycosyltransferase involved in cell wall biosynthesis